MWTGAAHREDDPDGVEFVIECFPAMITDGARGQFYAWTGEEGRLAAVRQMKSAGVVLTGPAPRNAVT